MNILDTWVHKGTTFAYCTGSEITEKFTCHKISDGQKEYAVDACDVSISIVGKMNVVLKFDGEYEIALGEYRIIH